MFEVLPGRAPHRWIQQHDLAAATQPTGKLDVFHQRLVGESADRLEECALDGVENHYGGRERLAGPSFIYNALGFPFETATTATKLTGRSSRNTSPEIV